jgi:hypothetical protein
MYNQHIPQKALGHIVPVQALKKLAGNPSKVV